MAHASQTVLPRGHLRDRVLPVVRSLPTNAAYLQHLSLAEQDGVVRMASNENADPPSARVRDALNAAYADVNLYPPPAPALVGEIARHHAVEPSQVLIGAGSTEIIEATLRTFASTGDQVLIPAPTWPVYRRRLDALGAVSTEVPLDDDGSSWRYDAGKFLDAIAPATKLVVICAPNNPTGNSIGIADLRRLAATGTPMLIDGAYCDFDPELDLVSLLREHDNVVVTRTFSKAYALAGLRLGYALGGSQLIGYIERMLVPGSAVSSLALHAGSAALADAEHYGSQLARIAGERERVFEALRHAGWPVWRSTANFLCIDARPFPGGADQLAAALLDRGVLVRPLGELVRITIGHSAQNDALLAAAEAVRRAGAA